MCGLFPLGGSRIPAWEPSTWLSERGLRARQELGSIPPAAHLSLRKGGETCPIRFSRPSQSRCSSWLSFDDRRGAVRSVLHRLDCQQCHPHLRGLVGQQMRDRVSEGKARAAQVRADLEPATRAAIDAFLASVPDLVSRMFMGPPDHHGRQAMYVATPAELAEWRRGEDRQDSVDTERR